MTTLTLPRRVRASSAETAATVAVAAGRVIGWAGRRAHVLPGLAGAALASFGTALVYLPAGVILGGVFLLAMDRQITLRRQGS